MRQFGPRPLPLFLAMVQHAAAASPPAARAALEGLTAYQNAPRRSPPPPMPVIARAGRAALCDYGGGGMPMVFVPSLINPPTVLDLIAERSMLRWLSVQGVRPLLVDWGRATPADRALDLAGHVTELLLPMLDTLGERVALAGYCLGGTLAIAAAVSRPVAGLALIATPWRFSGFPEQSRADISALWASARPAAEAIGLLPMEVLQTGFWQLDPERTVSKYAAFGRMAPGSDEARMFVAMEDWANGGSAIPFAAAHEMLEGLFIADASGRGDWRVGGTRIDPAALDCPVLNIVSTTDRIVPAAAAAEAGERRDLAQGHVGMVVGGRAKQSLWEPLADWLSHLHKG